MIVVFHTVPSGPLLPGVPGRSIIIPIQCILYSYNYHTTIMFIPHSYAIRYVCRHCRPQLTPNVILHMLDRDVHTVCPTARSLDGRPGCGCRNLQNACTHCELLQMATMLSRLQAYLTCPFTSHRLALDLLLRVHPSHLPKEIVHLIVGYSPRDVCIIGTLTPA